MASNFEPAGAPPPGVTPNFDDPSDSLETTVTATLAVMIALTTTFTIARSVARLSVAKFAIDDYFIIVAWALYTVYCSVTLWQARTGLGRHVWDVTATNAIELAKQSYALELINSPTTWFAKAALLFQLLRTFSPTKTGAVSILIQVLVYGNLAFYIAIFFAVLFECTPIPMIWDPTITTGTCVNRNGELIAAGVVNIVSDITIFILPLWAIWRLKISLHYKIGICAIFATGALACASSIGRLVYSVQVQYTTDSTFLIGKLALWSAAEIASVILCTCFPVMPRFMRVVREQTSRLSGSSRRTLPEHEMPAKDIEFSTFKRPGCKECQNGEACSTHGSLNEEPTAWSAPQSVTTDNGIQRTISIELTSQKTSTRDLV